MKIWINHPAYNGNLHSAANMPNDLHNLTHGIICLSEFIKLSKKGAWKDNIKQ